MFPILLALSLVPADGDAAPKRVPADDILARHKEQYDEIERYLDRQIADAEKKRPLAWKRDFSTAEAYERSVAPWRKRLAVWLGGTDYRAPDDFAAWEEKLAETKAFAAYRVWFTAFEDVRIYGVLLLPKGAAARRPAVIAIHGMQGSPESVCGLADKDDYHRRFGARLAEAGHVVFAPLDVNTGKARQWLDRKAKMVGARLQGLEQFKIRRVVDYLEKRPEVDGKRVGVYGISWGGRTAMNAAALDRRLAACVVSGHFMDSTPKMVTPSPHYSTYIEAAEDYAWFERHAREFSDADICSLVCPRPLFVENGREDRVAYWKMAQAAFEPVKGYYEKLGAGEKAVFHVFEGGHVVHGDAALEFLAKHLRPGR